MPQSTLTFATHEEIRMLFGPRDRFLRQIRTLLGVDVVVRGEEIRLQGEDAQVQQALPVLNELREVVRSKGRLNQGDVDQVLAPYQAEAVAEEAAIDLLEKSKQIEAQSSGQADYIHAMQNNDLVFCIGPAGSGKTFLSVAMAIHALRTERVRKIVLVRPAVEAGEKLGFLPGDLLAKVNPFLRPLLDALGDMLNFDQVKRYMDNDVIEIVPLAFMRGRTLNNTFIILDEGQNTTVTQMKMFLTRMGTHSKIVVTGDITQVDLQGNVTCGLTDATNRLSSIDGVATVELTGQDIVRHRLVREIVSAYEQDNEGPRIQQAE